MYVHPGTGEIATQEYDIHDDKVIAKIKKLVGPYIMGRKCVGQHWMDEKGEVSLYKPDNILDTTNWVTVLMVSSKCKILTQEQFEEWNATNHVFMRFPEWGHGFHKPGFQLFIVSEYMMNTHGEQMGGFVLLEPR